MTLLIYVKQIKTKTFLLSIIRVTRVTADYDETIKRFHPQMVMKSFFSLRRRDKKRERERF